MTYEAAIIGFLGALAGGIVAALAGATVTRSAREAEIQRTRDAALRALIAELIQNVKVLNHAMESGEWARPSRAAWDEALRIVDLTSRSRLLVRNAYAAAAVYDAAVQAVANANLWPNADATARTRSGENARTRTQEARDAFGAALASLIEDGLATEDERP